MQTALSTQLKKILDGEGGKPSPLAGIAPQVLLGTRLNETVSRLDAVEPGDWTALTLAAGWAVVSGYHPPEYRIVGDWVEFRGVAKHAAGPPQGTLLFTLPAEAQPPTKFTTAVGASFDNGAADWRWGGIFVYPTSDGSAGQVEYLGDGTSANSRLHLDGMRIPIGSAT